MNINLVKKINNYNIIIFNCLLAIEFNILIWLILFGLLIIGIFLVLVFWYRGLIIFFFVGKLI